MKAIGKKLMQGVQHVLHFLNDYYYIRKLLVSDMTDIKARQEEEGQLKGGGSSKELDDPVVLKLKLKYAIEMHMFNMYFLLTV